MDPTSIALYYYNNVGNYPYNVECENSDDWASVIFYQDGCIFISGVFVSFQCDGPNVDLSIYSSTTCEPSSLGSLIYSGYADSNSCPIVNTTSYSDQYSILQCVSSSPSFAPSGPSPAPTPYNQKYFQQSYYYDCTAQSTPYANEVWALDNCVSSNYGSHYMYMQGVNPDGSLSLYQFVWYSSSLCSGTADYVYSLAEEGVPSSCDSSAPFWIASVTAEISGSVGYKYFEDTTDCESDDWDSTYLLGSGCITVDSSSSYRLSCDSDGNYQETDYYGSNTCSGSGVSSTSSVAGFLSIGDCLIPDYYSYSYAYYYAANAGISQFYCPNPTTISTVRSPTLAPSTPTVIDSGYFLYSEYQAYSQCNMPGFLLYFPLGVCFVTEYYGYNYYFNFVGILDPETNYVGLRQEYFNNDNCTSLVYNRDFKPFAGQECSLAFLSTAKIVDTMQPGYIGNLSFISEESCASSNYYMASYLNSGCSLSSISTCQGSEVSTTYYNELDIVCAGQSISDGVGVANSTCALDYYYYFDTSLVTTTCIPQPSASPTNYPSFQPTIFIPPSSSSSSTTSSSVSAGGIAGIVIAVVVLLVVCGVGIYFRLKSLQASDAKSVEPPKAEFANTNPMVDSNL